MPRLRWFQLAATTALFVMFIAQAIQIQDVNRKIALLYERLKVDQERMMDTTPALEAAGSVVSILPVLALFVALQRTILPTATADAVKG